MFEIKPRLDHRTPCPRCAAPDAAAVGVAFPGMHILADCRCPRCGTAFFHDLPSSHGLFYPSSLEPSSGRVTPDPSGNFFAELLATGFAKPDHRAVPIERRILKSASDVVLVNGLDYLYGHVLLRLFNAQAHLDAPAQGAREGVVVLVPRCVEALVPEGVAEAWIVDLPLSAFRGWLSQLDAFVREQLPRFDRVRVSAAFPLHDYARIDAARFTRVAPFDRSRYYEQPLHVTFVAREDRLWLGTPGAELAQGVGRRHAPLRKRLIERQNAAVAHVFDDVRRRYRDATCHVVGLGRTGTFPAYVDDLRDERPSLATEARWLTCYAQSQLVFGVHGSNMLLPTLLAAGFLELLPSARLGNFLQDVALRRTDPRTPFLSRFVSSDSSVRVVRDHVGSMLSGLGAFLVTNMLDAHGTYAEHGDASDLGIWATRMAEARARDARPTWSAP